MVPTGHQSQITLGSLHHRASASWHTPIFIFGGDSVQHEGLDRQSQVAQTFRYHGSVVRIPSDAHIPIEKLTHYLLVPRDYDDKSRFLAQAGFTQANPDALLAAIRQLAAREPALADRENEYGTFYRVEGELHGVTEISLAVVTIWLRRRIDGVFQFITLKPKR